MVFSYRIAIVSRRQMDGESLEPFEPSKELIQTWVTPNPTNYPRPKSDSFELSLHVRNEPEIKAQKALSTCSPKGFLSRHVTSGRPAVV